MNAVVTTVPGSPIPTDTSKAPKAAPVPKVSPTAALLPPVAVKLETPKKPVKAKPPAPPRAPSAKAVKKVANKAAHAAKLAAKPKPAAPNVGGRAPIYGETMHTVSFKCTKEQHATFLKAGGNVYLRARLDELTAHFKKGGAK